MIKIIIFFLCLLYTSPVDHVYLTCKDKLGGFIDREILIINDICVVRSYDIYVDVDSFLGAAIRKLK